MVCSTVLEKYLKKMELKDSIKDSVYLYWASSPIEHSISGTHKVMQRLWFRKKLHLGLRSRSKERSFLCQISLRTDRHFIFWNPGLPPGHDQKKTDDGEWKSCRSASLQRHSRLWWQNSLDWRSDWFLQGKPFQFLEKYWFISSTSSIWWITKRSHKKRLLMIDKHLAA